MKRQRLGKVADWILATTAGLIFLVFFWANQDSDRWGVGVPIMIAVVVVVLPVYVFLKRFSKHNFGVDSKSGLGRNAKLLQELIASVLTEYFAQNPHIKESEQIVCVKSVGPDRARLANRLRQTQLGVLWTECLWLSNILFSDWVDERITTEWIAAVYQAHLLMTANLPTPELDQEYLWLLGRDGVKDTETVERREAFFRAGLDLTPKPVSVYYKSPWFRYYMRQEMLTSPDRPDLWGDDARRNTDRYLLSLR